MFMHMFVCCVHMRRYLILDEGHRVKNEDALISQGMRQVNRNHVIMLTGVCVSECFLCCVVHASTATMYHVCLVNH